ncbi:hypothetical protein [Streptomyces sp. NBC_01803]|uniref:hypothetical protein n=1 Tax=Streptomyces sp. NBC_01803 TaxID=2975946 RepID=UPI002DDA1A97|nr:hypothetical protein [Streptomyces sp. NBC_01803]WSA46588.1 hypothetical protein OIE51_21815 [Streptomyces sp. NBC_01803]
MEHWWYRNIVEPGKLPLLLALTAFIVTFLTTRSVTRMIRAGHGPFHDVSAGGHHVHHAVPGVILMCVGGFGGVAAGGRGWVAGATAVVFGLGAGLVMDEFALILYLQDVYWSEQGQKSVEAVVLTASLLVIMLVGFSPLGVNDIGADERQDRASVLATLVGNFALALTALLKGKFRVAILGALIPVVALIGAVRLARPGSPWATRLYRRRPRTRARAERRARRHEAHWGALERRVGDLLGGTPDDQREPPRPGG